MEYRVRLQTTIDDVEDIIAKTLWNQFSGRNAVSCLLTGCAAAVLSFLALLLIEGLAFEWRFVLACLIGILAGIAWLPIRKYLHLRRIHRIALSQYGKNTVTEWAYEIKDIGLLISGAGHDITYHWDQLSEAKDDNGDVFIATKGGFHIIRKRAFSSDEAKKEYIAEINRRIGQGKEHKSVG